MKKTFALTLAAFAALSALPAAASADDRIERQVYESADFPAKRAQAIQMLQKKGYQVQDVDADSRRGKPVLEIEAYKNGREYDIILSYPQLEIIRERVDN
ncbi:PepSY domain-containing protein [Bergeriella denitrificans]|uniref:Hypothetical periplasmic protein n=1 Tax=Bergeriella denitrificans TaxID=494 RepID=A0A378UKU8_BERDE|nr:PepSY domain-containing protein [Bergeriella denitrificans]STZ77323.1 Hypothetical periplasmic protein [Bergeriella denitrificans]